MRWILDVLLKLAESQSPLLIIGPRGSGRSALARTIHRLSPWSQQRLVVVDCRRPRFEEGRDVQALLLEEVGEAPPTFQQQLLGWLEDGGVKTRIMATTTEAIDGRVGDGSFRRDLYFRLNVLHVVLPDLAQGALVDEQSRAHRAPLLRRRRMIKRSKNKPE